MLVEQYLPDEMAIEAPFFGKNVQSMLKLGRAQGVAMAAACMVVSPFYLAAAMGFLAIHFYNGEPGERNRVVNYLFYPMCLLAIGLVAMYVF